MADQDRAPLALDDHGTEDGGVIAADPTPAPGSEGSFKELLTDNLFKDVKNSVLTLVFGAILLWIGWKAVGFVFLNEKLATRDGEQVLVSSWEVVRDGPLVVYMVGNRFGGTGISFLQLWAGIWTIGLALGLVLGLARDPDAPPMRLRTQLGLIGAPALAIVAVLSMTTTPGPALCVAAMVAVVLGGRAASRVLPSVVTDRLGLIAFVLAVVGFFVMTGFDPWDNVNRFGGLLLTFTVSIIAIALSFPIGVVMALARRSSFPLIRPLAVAYIELIRGVPLITLLFIGQFALGFLLPPGTDSPPPVWKAIVMFTLFTGAYVAEVVRGGLQSVPAGQTEAGQAVGLQPLTITFRIVLPQALRNSIPALIGQFISLVKDTSLLEIIGILELLAVTGPILGSLSFANQNFTPEAYAFVGFIYWVICFTMSRASQRLETRLGVGTR